MIVCLDSSFAMNLPAGVLRLSPVFFRCWLSWGLFVETPVSAKESFSLGFILQSLLVPLNVAQSIPKEPRIEPQRRKVAGLLPSLNCLS
jgi:hypothetical protein